MVASEGRNALMRMLLGSVIPGLITRSPAPVPVLVCKLRPRATADAKASVLPLKTSRAVKPATQKPATQKPAAQKPTARQTPTASGPPSWLHGQRDQQERHLKKREKKKKN